MTFATDAKTTYLSSPAPTTEDDTRGIAAATVFENATGQITIFVRYEGREVVVDVNGTKFIIHKVRVYQADDGQNARTVTSSIIRTCTNLTTPHTHKYTVIHEGMYDSVAKARTTKAQRSAFFIMQVGKLVADIPNCPTCTSPFAD